MSARQKIPSAYEARATGRAVIGSYRIEYTEGAHVIGRWKVWGPERDPSTGYEWAKLDDCDTYREALAVVREAQLLDVLSQIELGWNRVPVVDRDHKRATVLVRRGWADSGFRDGSYTYEATARGYDELVERGRLIR